MRFPRSALAAAATSVLFAAPALASFHFMQIEQVIGGLSGNTNAQAIQLRMRTLGQNLVSNGQLVVRDAAGLNPVVLIAFPSNVLDGSTGARVLAVTSTFAGMVPVTPDFTLTNRIPDSYLAAGSLTWEDHFGGVLWRLSWGGAGYTGPGTGLITNDADGNFNPPFAGPMPSTTAQALLFQGGATAPSTNNAADYALTPGAATFTNNAGESATTLSVGGGRAITRFALSAPAPDPVRTSMRYSIELPRAARARVRVLDVSGRIVETLADGPLDAGVHGFSWNAARRDGSRLASGVYVLELSAAGERQARRFVVID